MRKNVLGFVTAVNTVALVGLVAVSLDGGDDGSSLAPPSGSPAASKSVVSTQVAELEQRIAALEERLADPASAPAPSAILAPVAPGEEAPSPGQPSEAAAPLASEGVDPKAPVTHAELNKLIEDHLTEREAEKQRQWAKAVAKPKKTLTAVARELELDPRQESEIRVLYHDMERASMRTLFGVGEEDLEGLKAQIDQSQYDPRLKEELRERIAVNWTRHQAEFSVMWVKLDARLRKILDEETLARFYRNDVQLDDKEFPDIKTMFFPETVKKDDAGE